MLALPAALSGLSELPNLGLNILLPLAGAAFDAACAPVPGAPRLADLLDGAKGALVVGSGGPRFFDHFEQAGVEAADGMPDPLDRYTRRVVMNAVADALGARGIAHAVYFPFVGGAPLIPFQRVGRAAGIGPPGPLGLQIHPVYGPWWAYRALLVVDQALPDAVQLGDACAGCPAPCVAACPGSAVARSGFSIPGCHAHRFRAEPCRLSCASRIACVRGPEHRYRDEELAFHMAASMPKHLPVA
jgi:hypothetical protein